MRYFIVLLFFGIAWQCSFAAVLPIKPDSPSLSVSEKEENVQLDNVLGPNLSEETKTIPLLAHLASLRTNEEPSVKENTEMFGNEDPKTESPPLSNFEKVEPLEWTFHRGPPLSEETINILRELHKMSIEKKEVQVSIPQFTQKTELSPRFWFFLVKLILVILFLTCWLISKYDS
ncbi:uncharacterized protein LOC119547788 isoform X2 [Drosophila subpulchrella]|uniref:uncharacterized protein LOC119547788 isoform X2 n=1 Tax=Drosophila subpulchrella TaxID=1486046 RepID=UPI0018A178B9|nr:uncharacterized protein LOC119547788 isoform X2 [Drosophila subpulchrella]